MGIMAGRRRRAQVEVAKAAPKPAPKAEEPSMQEKEPVPETIIRKKGKHGLV